MNSNRLAPLVLVVSSAFLVLAAAPSVLLAADAAETGAQRIICFGAHPDDCEIQAGGTAALWAKKGHKVKFVSVTNGDIGHWRDAGGPLARRRNAEVQEAPPRRRHGQPTRIHAEPDRPHSVDPAHEFHRPDHRPEYLHHAGHERLQVSPFAPAMKSRGPGYWRIVKGPRTAATASPFPAREPAPSRPPTRNLHRPRQASVEARNCPKPSLDAGKGQAQTPCMDPGKNQFLVSRVPSKRASSDEFHSVAEWLQAAWRQVGYTRSCLS